MEKIQLWQRQRLVEKFLYIRPYQGLEMGLMDQKASHPHLF